MKANLRNTGIISIILISITIFILGCKNEPVQLPGPDTFDILFLHHSTGMTVWKGKTAKNAKIKRFFGAEYDVPEWFNQYNQTTGSNYFISERPFPKGNPYPWNNYPFDYYNIWVKNAGDNHFEEEPTLEILTRDYDMIIFKHCFPVSHILPDNGTPDIDSPEKRIENYKLQYAALKDKLHEFSGTKFLVWTSAALVETKTTPEQAALAREFVDWVRDEWDVDGDNIHLWDFYDLETEGTLYLKEDNARSKYDSHPNPKFTEKIAPLFCERIVDVIETNGANTTLTGHRKN